MDPYLVTTLPGARKTPDLPPPTQSPSLISPHPEVGGVKSFSPIPPPPIIRQQQRDRSHPPSSEEESRPPSELFYDSVPAETINSPPIPGPHNRTSPPIPGPSTSSREASPYEEVPTSSTTSTTTRQQQPLIDEDDPIIEEMLTYTTGVVKSVMELSSKLSKARPNEYVELVKVCALILVHTIMYICINICLYL